MRVSDGPLLSRRLVAAVLASMAASPSLIFAAAQQVESPSGAIRVKIYGSSQNFDITLASKKRPDQEISLCSSDGNGPDVMFSPDEQWIIVSDGGASMGVGLRLFQRQKGLRYKERKGLRLDDRLEELALPKDKATARYQLDHRYVSFLMWDASSTAFMIMLSGHDSSRLSFPNGWFAIYDVRKDTISFDAAKYRFDLRKTNAAAIQTKTPSAR